MSARPEGQSAPTSARVTRGPARAVRVSVLAGSSLLLAAGGHVVGGGRSPSVGLLLVAGVLLAPVAAALTARRCRLGTLLPVLAVEQLLLHLWFSAAAATGCGDTTDMTAMTAMTDMAGHHSAGSPLGADCVVSAPTSADPTPWAMWAAHLLATAATAWLLARGEAWLWAVADRIVAAATARPSLRRPLRTRLALSAGRAEPGDRVHQPAAPRGPPLPLALS